MQFSHTIDIQSVNKIPQNNREKNTIKVMKQYINDRWKQSKTLTFSKIKQENIHIKNTWCSSINSWRQLLSNTFFMQAFPVSKTKC